MKKAKYDHDSVKQPAKKWELDRVKEVEGHASDKESIKRQLSSRRVVLLCRFDIMGIRGHNVSCV